MRKQYYFPAAGSLIILALILSSLGPPIVSGGTLQEHEPTLTAGPSLQVTTIAEDDAVRKTGVMALGLAPTEPGWPASIPKYSWTDYMAQYKILVTFNGVPISPDYVFCQVVEKDVVHPIDPQFSEEVYKTKLTDRSDAFVCKVRWITSGVGVLDLYYLGPKTALNVADYVVVFSAGARIGRSFVWGSDVQNVCVLGWMMGDYGSDDPLGPFASSQEAVIWQRYYLGLPIPISD